MTGTLPAATAKCKANKREWQCESRKEGSGKEERQERGEGSGMGREGRVGGRRRKYRTLY